MRRAVLLAAIKVVVLLAGVACGEQGDADTGPGSIPGELKKWHPITIGFSGPVASESATSPNPFLDYRLQVTFTGPNGQAYETPGFFDGDGNGDV